MKGNLHIAPHTKIADYKVLSTSNKVIEVELSPEQEHVVTIATRAEIKLPDGKILTVNEHNIYYARVETVSQQALDKFVADSLKGN